MQFKLETPEHQRNAIRSVAEVFRGMERNTYDNATDEDIRANYCSLPLDALMANIRRIAADREQHRCWQGVPCLMANSCLPHEAAWGLGRRCQLLGKALSRVWVGRGYTMGRHLQRYTWKLPR